MALRTPNAGEAGLAPRLGYLVALALFLGSGLAGLIYEVLWMRELGLLFGNTAYASATTLAAFFLGLAVGGHYWGRRIARSTRPLLIYALLELAVAVSAAGYFVLLSAYHAVYGAVFSLARDSYGLFLVVKLVLALAILFPPAFFMGGTLPAISQFATRVSTALGRRVSLLYAVNTLGAALGAYAAAFVLVPALGFQRSYLTAMGLTLAVALGGLVLGWRYRVTPRAEEGPAVPETAATHALPYRAIQALAVLSGVLTLGLQVLWVRMFAQVLQNSVYTFSAILVTFLIGLAAGAALLRILIGRGVSPSPLLSVTLMLAGLGVAASPLVFSWWTEGLGYFGGSQDWSDYLRSVFGLTAVVVGLPVLFMGMLFPLLLQLAAPCRHATGQVVGRLAALNTAGGILGALAAGFILLDGLGLWGSIRLLAVLYLLAALLVAYRPPARAWQVWAPALGLLLLVSVLDGSRLPLVKLRPVQLDESLVEAWEGSAGTVAVVQRGASRVLRFNNHHTLGGTAGWIGEALWGHIPVQLHPRARSVFFLGMGTGITAGAALSHPVERVVVAELVPEVAAASRKYFSRYLNGLFEDPRASVVVEDARNYLLGTRERFDVIVSDLFIPWEAGAGNLYTLEHYRTVRERLNPGGLFMQWLPLSQVSRRELDSIAHTLLEVFPEVTVWRSDFFSGHPTLGLMGRARGAPLAPDVPWLRRLDERARAQAPGGERVPPLAFYCGNLSGAAGLVAGAPISTDDRPVIEYQAPVSQRGERAHRVAWLTGRQLIRFLHALQEQVPPARDPFLSALPVEARRQPYAGLALHWSRVLTAMGEAERAELAMADYRRTLDGGHHSDLGMP